MVYCEGLVEYLVYSLAVHILTARHFILLVEVLSVVNEIDECSLVCDQPLSWRS